MQGISYSDLMRPSNHGDFFRMCQMLASSSVCPKSMANDAGAVMVSLELGGRLGFSVLQSLQSIAVINGRPTLWGDAALAAVKGSPLYDGIDETSDGTLGKPGYRAICTVWRKGEHAPVTRAFSHEDAAAAALLGKQGPWRQYPKRMFQMRARAFALRDCFPDVLSGMQIREEVEDYTVDAQTGARTQRPDAARTVDSQVELTESEHQRLSENIARASQGQMPEIKSHIQKFASGGRKARVIQQWKDRQQELKEAASAQSVGKEGEDLGYADGDQNE